MEKPTIAIKLSPRNYNGLVDLGNRVFASMTGNLDFTTPSPALSVLQTAITDVVNAIAKWGSVHSRGSHADLLDLRSKSLTLHQQVTAEAEYVQNTAQLAAGNDYVLMGVLIDSSGFNMKGAKTPQGVLEAVQNLHHLSSRSLNPNQAKLKWKKPQNVTTNNNVRSNIIFRGTTSVFSAAVQIATTGRTDFIDTNNTGAAIVWYYWIVAVGAAGNGAASGALMISYPAM